MPFQKESRREQSNIRDGWYARKESNLPRQNRNLESYPMDHGRIFDLWIIVYHTFEPESRRKTKFHENFQNCFHSGAVISTEIAYNKK